MNKTKFQKRIKRRKIFEKSRNLSHNNGKSFYILEVFKNVWLKDKTFRNHKQVKNYIKEIEIIREKDDKEIMQSRIIDMRTNKIIYFINGKRSKNSIDTNFNGNL